MGSVRPPLYIESAEAMVHAVTVELSDEERAWIDERARRLAAKDVLNPVALSRAAFVRELIAATIEAERLAIKEMKRQLEVERLSLKFSKDPLGLIADLVASTVGVQVSALRSKRRTGRVVQARHMAMFLAREFTSLTLVEVGEYFGTRDHTTVCYAIDQVKKRADADPRAQELLQALRELLNGRIEASLRALAEDSK